MASSHLFAFCKDAICVAEDFSVAFYAPKSLKKFRVERLGGRRIAGLYVLPGTSGEMQLHVVDAEASWYLFSLSCVELLASSSIRWSDEVQIVVGSDKPMMVPRLAMMDANNTLGKQGVLEAHFHEAGGELHCILLTPCGVYEAPLRDTTLIQAKRIMIFPTPTRDCIMSTGRSTGLVFVGQRGKKWARYSLHGQRDTCGYNQQQQFLLPINIQSLTCSPVTQSVAVGGVRGELLIYPSITNPNYFSDHWHHTPLTALAFSVDGNSLYSGARESFLLVWSLSSYAYKKIGCSMGPIRSILPSRSNGSQLLMACAESTLATMDLLQMQVEKVTEGVQWSADEVCRGLVVAHWMGQPAVILTGLPNVVRLCDPFTQQALYSLHISSQMETIPNPPRHGIQHVGLLNDNRTIVTYEEFGDTTLPPLLRFWVYDTGAKRHIETQTIYSPHRSRMLAMQTDDAHRRVFTLSADSIKCWGELNVDVNDAYATGQKGWINRSSSATPSGLVRDMLLSPDGSLCFVSDDSVHAYSTVDLCPGQPWRRVLTLTQSVSLSVLCDLQLLMECRVVVARDESHVYFWSLASPHDHALVWTAEGGLTALCSYKSTSVLVATNDGDLWELSGAPENMTTVLGHASGVTPHCITLMKCLPGTKEGRVAVIDGVSGFRVLHVELQKAMKVQIEGFENAANAHTEGRNPSGKELQLQQFFREVDGHRWETHAGDSGALLDSAVHAVEAKKWLGEVLADSAYTAPPMSSVLSSYLRRRAGIPTL